MTVTTAAVVESVGSEFTLSEVELSAPRAGEVAVRMVAAGICRSDLSVAHGHLPFPLPGVLGHEGAGVVEAVGPDVTRVAVGDQVLLSFTSCGHCPNCRDGHPAYCRDWLPLNLLNGARTDGTSTVSREGTALGGHFFGQSSFARHAVVDERSLVRVAADAPLDLLAPLGCGVLTGVGAVWKVLRPEPGARLLVTGAGSVGLSAVMAARLTPATQIIVADLVEDRLRLARELGATEVVDVSAGELREAVTELTGGAGVDGVVETTGNVRVLGASIGALAIRGTAVVVGAPAFGSRVSVDVNHLLPGRHVVGVTLGDAETETLIPVLADLVRAGRLPIDRLVTHYPFDEINTAVSDMLAGTTIKPVLRF